MPTSSDTSLPSASRATYRALYASSPAYGSTDHSQPVRALFSTLRARSVADIGCGNGEFCRWVRLRCKGLVVGVDFAARPRGAGILWANADATALPLPDGCVEWVTSFDMLEHLTEADVRHAVPEMARIARCGLLLKPAYRESVARGPAGEDLHPIVEPPAWWLSLLRELLPQHRRTFYREHGGAILCESCINS